MQADNMATIERFYGAFAELDAETMAACYAPDAHFRDPAFGELDASEAGDMWRMLIGGATDLRVELREHDADDHHGDARWIARYTFSQTGRPVLNKVHAHLHFNPEGLISDHVDHFGFHAWSRQALGTPGLLLGWTPLLRAATNRKARARLEAFRAERAAAA